MSRQHVVTLSTEQEADVRRLLRRRHLATLQRKHAQVLLLADTRIAGRYLTDEQIGHRVGLSSRSVARTRATYAAYGVDAALIRKPRSDTPRRLLTPAQERRVVELALSPAPEGCARWTLRLLRAEVIARGIVPAIAQETVRKTLKKGAVRPG